VIKDNYMIDLIIGLPIWFQISFLIVLLVVIVFVVIQMINKGYNFVFGKASIKLSGKNECTSNVHSNCKHVKDVFILLDEVIDILDKKMEYKFFGCLKKQMNLVDDKAAIIEGLLFKIYIDLIKSKNVVNPVDSELFQTYKLIISVIENNIIRKIRGFFRDNNYYLMNELEFSSYVDRKIDFIIFEALNMLNDFYFIKEPISREELYEANMKEIGQIRAHFEELFFQARLVSIEYHNKIQNLENNIKKLIEPWKPK